MSARTSHSSQATADPAKQRTEWPNRRVAARMSSILPFSFCILIFSGCHSRSICGDPWESPTIRATRALLVVPTDELKVLRIDGRNVRRSQRTRIGGMRAYYIPAGEHTLTATFRYAAPVSGGLLGEVKGQPLKLKQFFEAGREYAALYRIHPWPKPEPRWFLEAVVTTVFMPYDRWWSMKVVDRAEAGTELAADYPAMSLSAGADPSD